MKQAEAREHAEAIAAAIDEDNRELIEYRFRLSTAIEEKLKPVKELKARYALQQENLLSMRKQNDDLANHPSAEERALLGRLETLREKRKNELNLLEESKLELKEERSRAEKLDSKINGLEEERRKRVTEMRDKVKAYEDVLALCIEPYENGGLKITYIDLRRSFVLRPRSDISREAEVVGVSGCEEIASEFNRRMNVGALLYRMRERLKSRSL